jgi:hypothetical protein
MYYDFCVIKELKTKPLIGYVDYQLITVFIWKKSITQ